MSSKGEISIKQIARISIFAYAFYCQNLSFADSNIQSKTENIQFSMKKSVDRELLKNDKQFQNPNNLLDKIGSYLTAIIIDVSKRQKKSDQVISILEKNNRELTRD